MDIINNIFNEKGLSDNSKKLYLSNLRKLNNGSPIKNLNFLKDMPKCLALVADYSDNSKRSYIISACSILKQMPKMKTVYNKWFALLGNVNTDLKKVESSGIKTQKQADNWMSWDEIMAIRDALKPDSVEHLLLSLYVDIPPRRALDYTNMKMVDDRVNNYCDMINKQFIFRKYKTAKTMGEQIEPIPEDLYQIIKAHHGKTPSDYLLGKAYTSPNITKMLNKIFKSKVSVNMLRHIYLSDKYGQQKEDMKQDSIKMGHSQSMQADYIKQ
jgi:integrase